MPWQFKHNFNAAEDVFSDILSDEFDSFSSSWLFISFFFEFQVFCENLGEAQKNCEPSNI